VTEQMTFEEEAVEAETGAKVYREVDLDALNIAPLADVFLSIAEELDKRVVAVLRNWLSQGILGETLELVIRRGFASDEKGAMLYLNNFVIEAEDGDFNVSIRGHLNGNSNLERRPAAEDVTTEKGSPPAVLQFGRGSHGVILEIMRRRFMSVPSLSVPHQPDFFHYTPSVIAPSGTQFMLPVLEEAIGGLAESSFKSPNWHRRLQVCLKAMASFSDRDAWREYNAPADQMINRLRGILKDLFGGLLYQMPPANGNPDLRYLQMLTYMTWGYTVIDLFKDSASPFEPSCILTEVAVLPHNCGINAGRMDALKIVSINGEKPSQEQWNKIASIYYLNEPRPTVGQIILAAYQLFGRNIEFEVIDLKCSVGDAVGKAKIINPKEIKKEPIRKHAEQIKRYIFFTAVSFHLACMEAGLSVPKDVWKNQPPLYTGWLVYLMHNQSPMIHKVRLSRPKQREEFQKRVAFNFHRAELAAKANSANNLLNEHLRDMARRSVSVKEDTLFSAAEVAVTEPPRNRVIFDIAAQYREHYDKEGLVEIVGYRKDGKPILMLHLDRLSASEEWQSGKIISERFDLPHGGFIRCLNPEHNDSDPSCQLRLLEGRAICYGCGFKAGLMGDITHNGQVMSVSIRRDSRKKPLTEEHYKIMASAQAILTASLEGSKGARYLEERGISLDLAREHGVGFCDSGFIFDLLDRGYPIEQLAEYGFVGFSVRAREDSWLVQQIVKEYGHDKLEKLSSTKKVAGITRTAWLYNPMAGRLTFPMSLLGGNRISNFYCRMPYCKDKSWAHRKLNTGAAQGASNIDPLWWPEDDTIIVTEGVFDALSLILMGVRNILAITGLDNPEVLRAIENSGKIIAIALDNDERGREKTAKLLARFEKAGLEAYDYTEEFAAKPDIDFREGDDFNSWYLRHMQGVNT